MALEGSSLASIIGYGIFISSIQASIGSVEMSSKFSVVNFSKDQDTLDNANSALKAYIIIGTAWMLGAMLSMYASYGICGAWIGFALNALMMAWIIISYMVAFRKAAKKYNLIVPKLF